MTTILILAAAMAAGSPAMCRETTYHADGTRSVREVPDDGRTTSSASSSSSGGGSAHSSVSVSSSSSSSGRSASSATSDGDRGQTVKVERDADGCRITIVEKGE
jgi:hypothetical protein